MTVVDQPGPGRAISALAGLAGDLTVLIGRIVGVEERLATRERDLRDRVRRLEEMVDGLAAELREHARDVGTGGLWG